jgi:16S rRNA (guanine966-N2)-methyltransferase
MNRKRHIRDTDEPAPPKRPVAPPKIAPTRLRIVAGELGGRKIDYNGDPGTRPMKERTRESVFSLLGGYLYNTFAIDLFGGTGILAFESISRGAERAIILEMSRPAVSTMLASMQKLGLSDRIDVYNVDTLRWLRNLEMARSTWPDLPWIVYCCPPYKMWKSDTQRLCDGLMEMYALSPPGSRIVCETESDFDPAAAMPGVEWDIRNYDPAKIAICEK